jgi:hypothetical protein
MRGYIDHILRITRAVKHAGRAISVGQEIKEEIEFYGDLERVEEYVKSVCDFGW